MADHDHLKERSFISLLNILQSGNCLPDAVQRSLCNSNGVDRHPVIPSETAVSVSPSTTAGMMAVTMQCPHSEDEQFLQALSPSKNRKFSMNALYQAAACVRTPSSAVQQPKASRSLKYTPVEASMSLLPMTADSSTSTASTTTTESSNDGGVSEESKLPIGMTDTAVSTDNQSFDTDQLRGITQKPSGKWVSYLILVEAMPTCPKIYLT